MAEIDKDFCEIVELIKKDIRKTTNRVFENANSELVSLYFRIGKIVSESSTYGSNFINTLSSSLKSEFGNVKGYSARNLSRMKRFYDEYKHFPNLPPAVAKLPWTHNNILIEKEKDIDKRLWYAEKALDNGWGKIVLDHQIDLKLYERQADNKNKHSNFEKMLTASQSELAQEIMKDPYIFELAGLQERVTEREIEERMIENIKNVLLELGKGFSFVGNQYKISTETKDYYIDLLFYHLELRCYIVVELKNTDFEPDFMGQLQFYVKAIDETLKKNMDNDTIGMLLCRKKDKLSVDWSLKSANIPAGIMSYEVVNCLPTEEEINNMIELTR